MLRGDLELAIAAVGNQADDVAVYLKTARSEGGPAAS